MPASVLDFLSSGLLQFGWWEMLAYLLVVTQLTIFTVTLYLHRSRRIAAWISIRPSRISSVSGRGSPPR